MVALSSHAQPRVAVLRPGHGLFILLVPVAGLLVAACAAPVEAEEAGAFSLAQEPRPARARISSWNIRRLGHNVDGRAKDLSKTASVITDSCDAVAVPEVMQTQGATLGFDALLTTLGADWGGVVAKRPRPDTSSANAERYAYYFRKTSAAICSG